MSLPASLQLPLLVAVGVFFLAYLAEKLHERRGRGVARLATGPAGQPRRWVRAVPLVSALTLAAMAWSLVTLLYASGGIFRPSQLDENRRDRGRHVVFVADLSPSMLLEDAGPDGNRKRSERAAEVVDGILQRLDGEIVYAVYGFYTDALPIILDARDTALVRNVFSGLPVWYVMPPGKTDLGTGIRLTLEQLRDYPDDSTTVFLCTDGDTIELGSIPKPPPSVRDVFILGVGDPDRGTFIDDHMSRQDAAVLRTVAGRLRGTYIDVNQKHLPTISLGSLTTGSDARPDTFGLVEWAIAVFAVAAVVRVTLPILLEYAGTDWRAVRVSRGLVAERSWP